MKNYSKILLGLLIMVVFYSACGRLEDKTKETISKGGETIGKSTTEFIEGVGDGIQQGLAMEIEISEDLQQKIGTGKYLIEGSERKMKNIFTLYIIFNEDFNQTISIKAYDKSGLEIGRTKLDVSGKKDDAGYFDFVFDERTKLENNGRVVIE